MDAQIFQICIFSIQIIPVGFSFNTYYSKTRSHYFCLATKVGPSSRNALLLFTLFNTQCCISLSHLLHPASHFILSLISMSIMPINWFRELFIHILLRVPVHATPGLSGNLRAFNHTSRSRGRHNTPADFCSAVPSVMGTPKTAGRWAIAQTRPTRGGGGRAPPESEHISAIVSTKREISADGCV